MLGKGPRLDRNVSEKRKLHVQDQYLDLTIDQQNTDVLHQLGRHRCWTHVSRHGNARIVTSIMGQVVRRVSIAGLIRLSRHSASLDPLRQVLPQQTRRQLRQVRHKVLLLPRQKLLHHQYRSRKRQNCLRRHRLATWVWIMLHGGMGFSASIVLARSTLAIATTRAILNFGLTSKMA